MSLRIEHHPNKSFEPFCFREISLSYRFKIDLNQAVREKSRGEALTNDSALKILKQIKLKSDILSFLTKPVVFFPSLFALTTATLCLPVIPGAVGTVVVAAKVISYVVSFFGVGYMMAEIFETPFFSKISNAYNKQSSAAATYIALIELAQEPVAFFL